MTKSDIAVEKNEENELPIPTAWRPIFSEIVNSFVKEDYCFKAGLNNVSAVSEETANHIKEYIEGYGEVLTQLSEETWISSVCIWMGTHWNVLIDLWTAGEGRSDLVLGAKVYESRSDYLVEIGMVYVP